VLILEHLIDADGIVIDRQSFRVIADYPLSTKFSSTVRPPEGARHSTRAGLAKAISMLSQRTYNEETCTSNSIEAYGRECTTVIEGMESTVFGAIIWEDYC